MQQQLRRLFVISVLAGLVTLLGIVLLTAKRSYMSLTTQNQYIASQIEEEGATIILSQTLSLLDGDRIVLSHKPYTHLAKTGDREIQWNGELYFLEKWQDRSKQPVRVWQTFVSPFGTSVNAFSAA